MFRSLLPFLVILFFFLSLFVYVKLAGPIPFSVNSVSTTKTDTFNVTGEGTATIKPDQATIRLGVQANGATAKDVQAQINLNINKVTDAIKKLGIDAKDIKTENYNVNPTYDYTSGKQNITGYTGNTNLVITVKDTDKANSILDTAIANGANQIGSINFDVKDKAKAEDQARTAAVADAKKKAENAAKMVGFKLGRLVNYSENPQGQVPPIIYGRAESLSTDAKTQVEPGSNEVKITVTLSYEIR